MNKKVSIIILATFLAIIVFVVSTNLQKQLINYVPTVNCYTVTEDIDEYSKIAMTSIREVNMPIEVVGNLKIVQDYKDIQDMYLKTKIYKGQLLVFDQFDTGENLTIIDGEEGKEKIAIKIRASENGASFILKKGSIINVYSTLSNEYANSEALAKYERQKVGSDDYGYSSLKLLSEVKVLGCFDDNGEEVENMPEKNIDTVLVSVLPEEAYIINLIRDIAVFNITEI